MPALIGEPVVTNLRAFLFCTRGCGCARAPGIPCALFLRGTVNLQNLGRVALRECGCLPGRMTEVTSLTISRERIALFRRPRDDARCDHASDVANILQLLRERGRGLACELFAAVMKVSLRPMNPAI